MANVISVIVIVVILAAAITYIVKAKRSGQKCIGCPSSKTCGATGASTCHCTPEPATEEEQSDCCCGK